MPSELPASVPITPDLSESSTSLKPDSFSESKSPNPKNNPDDGEPESSVNSGGASTSASSPYQNQEKYDSENSSSSEGSELEDNVKNSDTTIRKVRVHYPVTLPSLVGTRLEAISSNDDILDQVDNLCKLWSTDLTRLTEGKPLPSDYKNYALSILDKYPVLGQSVIQQTKNNGGSTPVLNHRPLVRKLSACIRNRRQWPKLKEKRKAASAESGCKTGACHVAAMPSKKRRSSNSPSRKDKERECSRSRSSPKPGPSQPQDREKGIHTHLHTNFHCSDEDQDIYLSEMTKSTDEKHLKLLLDTTLSRRRDLSHAGKSCPEMLKIYPALKNTKLMYEFDRMDFPASDRAEANLPRLLKQLSKYYDNPADNAEEEFFLLQKLQNDLQPNKNLPQVIRVEKVSGDTNSLETNSADSLRLIVYLDVDIIKDAYVVGKTLEWQIPPPLSTCKCLLTIFAAYIVFHRSYPKAYFNVLTFLETNIFLANTPTKLQTKYATFVQRFNEKLAK